MRFLTTQWSLVLAAGDSAVAGSGRLCNPRPGFPEYPHETTKRRVTTTASNDKDHGGRTALVEYSNKGQYIATHSILTQEEPQGAEIEEVADARTERVGNPGGR